MSSKLKSLIALTGACIFAASASGIENALVIFGFSSTSKAASITCSNSYFSVVPIGFRSVALHADGTHNPIANSSGS